MGSMIPFMSQAEHNGQALSWSRASVDGAPFMGQPSLLREDEWDERVQMVAYTKSDFFDITNAKEKAAYHNVLDRIYNSWCSLIFEEKFWRDTTKHYVIWVEYYMQDGSPTQGGAFNGPMAGFGRN